MVEKEARVHHKTVTKYSEGKLDSLASGKRSGSTGRSSRITAQRIDPRIWGVAKKLARKQLELLEGPQSKPPSTARLRAFMNILGGDEIIIHNNPNWRDRK